MPRLVKGPDGVIHSFPDDASDDEIRTALGGGQSPASASKGQVAPGATFSEKIGNAANMLRDAAVGFGKGAVHTGIDLAQLAANSGQFGVNAATMPSEIFDAARNRTAYTNTAQRVGGGIETAAELALPALKAGEAVPLTSRAGAAFNSVAKAANKVPVDLTEPGNVALRIADMAQRGGGTQWGPGPVRQFIQWATDPKKAPMNYEVARDFASNISRLSVDETRKLPPAMQMEIANLRVTLNKAVGEAAAKVGKGAEYAQAMTEYAKAMRLREAMNWAITKGLPYGSVGGGLYWAAKKLISNAGAE